ncbi:MAG: 50S ribosomal protein L22 [Candidatus Eisenbacteria bacterium]
MEARAMARTVRISPRKADRVLRLIRNQSVNRAEEILEFTDRPIAKQIKKVLHSAAANAKQKFESLDEDNLIVTMAVSGAGPTMKRLMPRAQRRATRILKRTSHITIVVGTRKTK